MKNIYDSFQWRKNAFIINFRALDTFCIFTVVTGLYTFMVLLLPKPLNEYIHPSYIEIQLHLSSSLKYLELSFPYFLMKYEHWEYNFQDSIQIFNL